MGSDNSLHTLTAAFPYVQKERMGEILLWPTPFILGWIFPWKRGNFISIAGQKFLYFARVTLDLSLMCWVWSGHSRARVEALGRNQELCLS